MAQLTVSCMLALVFVIFQADLTASKMTCGTIVVSESILLRENTYQRVGTVVKGSISVNGARYVRVDFEDVVRCNGKSSIQIISNGCAIQRVFTGYEALEETGQVHLNARWCLTCQKSGHHKRCG
jgi:hypothetical protein